MHTPRLGSEAKPEGPALWRCWQKALGSWGQRVTVLKCCPRTDTVRLLGDHGRREYGYWAGGGGVQAVESGPSVRALRGGQGLAWAGGLLCAPSGGVPSLPSVPCGEEVARSEK